MNKLTKKIIYRGNLKLITGLHIGGSNMSMGIGGPDKFVIRNPVDNLPYIPGSSLKGKMRSLIELQEGELNKGNPKNEPGGCAAELFGMGASIKDGHASRLIVRDCPLDEEKAKEWADKTEIPYTEAKTEASIDRITSKANPRTFERVPAKAEFKIEMVLNIFENDNRTEEQLIDTLRQAMQLLEIDYLGGQGSRGYGQVEFVGGIEEFLANGVHRTSQEYESEDSAS